MTRSLSLAIAAVALIAATGGAQGGTPDPDTAAVRATVVGDPGGRDSRGCMRRRIITARDGPAVVRFATHS